MHQDEKPWGGLEENEGIWMIYAVCIAMNVCESHDVWSRNLPMSSIREVLEEEIGVTELTESEVTDVKFASEQGEWSLPRPGHVPPPLDTTPMQNFAFISQT